MRGFIREELKNFLDLVNGLQPRDEFCREIDREVQKAKRSAAVRRSFMDMEDKLRHAAGRAREEGREEGRLEGLEEGRQEGLEEGRLEGLEEGRQEGTLATLMTLVESGTIALQTAAKTAGMSEVDFRKKMENLSKM